MRRFIFYPVFFIFILSFLETASIGMGVKPTEAPTQEPAGISSPAIEKQEQSTSRSVETREETEIPEMPKPGPAIPVEIKSIGPVPREKPAEVKQPKPEQPVSVEPEKKLPKAPPIRTAAGSITFFFDDADIFEVAHTVFGEVLKVNYIIDPKVKGLVTFRTVTPIPREEVLPIMEIILRLNGIGFVEDQGLYRIVPLTEVPKELVYAQVGKEPEKVAIELFTFKNVNIKDSMTDIENAIGLTVKGGTVRVLPIYRLNALMVIASTKEQMDYVRKWIGAFDGMFAVARPKIYVYPLQNSKAAHVASILQSIFSGGVSAPTPTPAPKTEPAKTTTPSATPAAPKTGPAAVATGTGFLVSPDTRVFADEITNSLIILATPVDYTFIEETVKKLDIMPRQVMIEVLIAEVMLTDELRFGLAWSLKTDINIKGLRPFERDINLSSEMGQRPSILTAEDAAKLTGTGFTFLATDPKGIVRARLEALASEAKLKVLASPHILASDNREARIQIGDQVPVVTSETPVEGTVNITRTIQYKDTGTILKVKPQINEGGLVSLDIIQDVSDYSIIKIYGSEYPVIYKREATTSLVVQDGQTIVIGGLIREKTDRTREGIPLLSKIPILGYLFGYTADTSKRTELIVLLTPHVIRNQQEAKDVTSEYTQRLKDVGKEIEIKR